MPYKTPEAQRAANRASYAKHKEGQRATRQEWEANNREKRRQYSATYRSKHPEEVRGASKVYNARYYAENGDKVRADQRKRNAANYAANPEKSLAATAAWEKKNPGRAKARIAKRRAQQAGARVVETVDRLIVAENDNWICQECFQPIDPNTPYRDPVTGRNSPGYLNADHIVPLSKGGDHSYANHQATHRICNQKKHNKLQTKI